LYSKLKLSPYTGPLPKKLEGNLPVKVCTVPVWFEIFYRRRCKKGPPCQTAGSDLKGKKRELLLGVDRNEFAISLPFEGHNTICSCEQCVIPTFADIPSRMKLGASLPDDDTSSPNLLAAISLYAETLWIAVSTVTTGTYALFMCHRCPQMCRPTFCRRGSDEDFVNPDFSVPLTVSLLPAIPFTTLPLEDDDLPVTSMTHQFGLDLRALHQGKAYLNVLSIRRQENVLKGDRITGLPNHAGNSDLLSRLSPKLFSARPEYRVHKALKSEKIANRIAFKRYGTGAFGQPHGAPEPIIRHYPVT
jgi:hypothetical protein